MTVMKSICPVAPDGKHTWVHGRCIDCDAQRDNSLFERMREERIASCMVLVAERLAGHVAR